MCATGYFASCRRLAAGRTEPVGEMSCAEAALAVVDGSKAAREFSHGVTVAVALEDARAVARRDSSVSKLWRRRASSPSKKATSARSSASPSAE